MIAITKTRVSPSENAGFLLSAALSVSLLPGQNLFMALPVH